MLHLLVASFRALPLDLMVPVFRRGGLFDYFSWMFFLLFLFSSVLFSCVSQSRLAIYRALSVWTPSHMRTPLARQRRQKKFGTIDHLI